MYLSGTNFNLDGNGLTLDDGPFFANAPPSLASGEVWTGDLFSASILNVAAPGLYSGRFDVLGGFSEGNDDLIGSAEFSLVVRERPTTVVVPGTANPWLAGDPNGATADRGDVAPDQSPVLAASVVGGQALMFTVTGIVDHGGEPTGPDGGGAYRHEAEFENGKSTLTAPINALVGVFLTDASGTTVDPGGLDFSTPASRDFFTLAPNLFQPFFIGDGLNSALAHQYFVAPAGATRLFLGTMDGYQWYGNGGAFQVEVQAVPEPVSVFAVGFGAAWLGRRRRAALHAGEKGPEETEP